VNVLNGYELGKFSFIRKLKVLIGVSMLKEK
jgi:hypothetical protein